jgi:integrase
MEVVPERKAPRRRTRGAGTIEQRGKDHFVVKVSFGRDPDTGKRVREAFVVRGSRADADRLLREKLTLRDQQHYRPSTEARSLLFGTYALDALARNPKARPHTRDRMRRLFQHYTPARVKAARLVDVSPALLAQARDELLTRKSAQSGEPLAPRTVNLVLSVWGRVLRMAVAEKRLAANPLRSIERASEKGRERVGRALSPAETETVLQAADGDPLAALWRLYLTLGLRPSEALALTWDPATGVDLAGARLTVSRTLARMGQEWHFAPPKTGKVRTLHLPLPVLVALKAHKARQNEEKLAAGEHYRDDQLVFADPGGYVIAPWVVQKRWKALLQRAKVATGYRLYDARHTALTRLTEYGLDFRNIGDIAGNSAKMIAEVYSHGRTEVQRAALDAIAGGQAG